MQRFFEVRRDQFGNPASGVSCTVYNSGTSLGTKSALYSANSSVDTPTVGISNPVLSGSDGIISFAVADGDKDLVFVGSDGTTEYRYRVNFFDSTTSTTIPVSSITLTAPSILTVVGSPGTSIALDTATQSANTVWAGPTSGGAVQPTFRALVAADVSGVAVAKSGNQIGIAGDKTWTGAQTLSSTVSVSGAATFLTTVAITGNLTASSNLILDKASRIKISTAYPWKSIQATPMESIWLNGTLPTKTIFQGTLYLPGFSASATNELLFYFELPYDYEAATDIYPYIDWSANGTNTGNIRWGIEYSAAKAFTQAAFPAPSTVYATGNIAADGTQYKLITSTFAAIIGTNFEPGEKIIVRMFRDGSNANDTLTDLSFFHGLGLHYQASRPGTKNKTVPFYT